MRFINKIRSTARAVCCSLCCGPDLYVGGRAGPRGLSCYDADGGGMLGAADKIDAIGECDLMAVSDLGDAHDKTPGHVIDADIGVDSGATETHTAGIAFNREGIVGLHVGDA